MSKEIEIEKLRLLLVGVGDISKDLRKEATKAIDAGYRKQSEGEWIDMGYYIHNKRIYKCSACANSEAKDALTSARYCPNCGAKMKGGAE